jgi:hypothetical protein
MGEDIIRLPSRNGFEWEQARRDTPLRQLRFMAKNKTLNWNSRGLAETILTTPCAGNGQKETMSYVFRRPKRLE